MIDLELKEFFDLEDFATTALYTSALSTSPREISIIEQTGGSIGIQDPAAWVDTMILILKTTDIEKPDRRDKFLIRESTYYLRAIHEGGPAVGTWTVEVQKGSRRA